MSSPVSFVVPPGADPELRIRARWAESLRDAMRDRGVNKYELQRRLAGLGVEVSRQGIESWLAAKTSPRPHVQQAIGTALDLPARLLFPLENLPAVAG